MLPRIVKNSLFVFSLLFVFAVGVYSLPSLIKAQTGVDPLSLLAQTPVEEIDKLLGTLNVLSTEVTNLPLAGTPPVTQTPPVQTPPVQTPPLQPQPVTPITPIVPETKATAKVRIVSKNTDNAERAHFGKINLNETKDITLEITAEEGRTIRYTGVTGLQAPFSFKGGSFPGIGGTCNEYVRRSCTLVITFTPVSQLGQPTGTGELRSRTDLTILFSDEYGQTARTSSMIVYGNTPVPGERFSYHIPGGKEFNLIPALVNTKSAITFSMGAYGDIKTPIISGLKPPYYAAGTRCEPYSGSTNFVLGTQCYFSFEYRPTAVGEHRQTVSVQYSSGVETFTDTVSIIGNAYGGSDLSVTPNKNLLIVYNEQSQESKTIKDYYLANRPGFSDANVLGIYFPYKGCVQNCWLADGDLAPTHEYEPNIRDPILRWIMDHPEKEIRHIVFVRGVPTRIWDARNKEEFTVSTQFALAEAFQDLGQCEGHRLLSPSLRAVVGGKVNGKCHRQPSEKPVGYFSPAKYPGTVAVSTHLDMGSLDATLRYIDKLKAMHAKMPNPSLFISALGTGSAGRTYFFEDAGGYAKTADDHIAIGRILRDSVKNLNSQASIDYRAPGTAHARIVRDVLGFFSWGYNGRRPSDYPIDGTLVFEGNSNWYLIQTAESFNGRRDFYQGSYVEWFAKNAFGGSNYENTPVAVVGHIDEPYLAGIHDPSLFPCWEAGNLFIDCASYSRQSAVGFAVGDPWVRK